MVTSLVDKKVNFIHQDFSYCRKKVTYFTLYRPLEYIAFIFLNFSHILLHTIAVMHVLDFIYDASP